MIQLDHSLKRISETKIEFRYRFVNMQDSNFGYISVWHQYPKDATNIEIPSPRPKNCHQHPCSRKFSESLQRGHFQAFEIVYYQWEGFLSSERLIEGFKIVLEFISFIP